MLKRIAILFLALVSYLLGGQNQKIADSLGIIYQSEELNGPARLEILENLAFNEQNNLPLRLSYANELIDYAIELNKASYLFAGYLQKGNAYVALEDYSNALQAYIKGEKVAISNQFNNQLPGIYMSIANIYSDFGDFENTINYYKKGIQIYESSSIHLSTAKDSLGYGSLLFNIADEYLKRKNTIFAAEYLEKADAILNEDNHELAQIYILGSFGQLYGLQGNTSLALKNLEEAITKLMEKKFYAASSEYLTCMASVSLKDGNLKAAREYGYESFNLAKTHNYNKERSEASQVLFKIDSTEGKEIEAMRHQIDYLTYDKLLAGNEKQQEISNLMQKHQYSQQKAEEEILKIENEKVVLTNENQKKTIWGTLLIILLVTALAITLYRRYGYVKKTNVIISEERDKSDNLLKNILPEDTAKELKQHGAVEAKRFESVTVMFTDFKGFTSYAEHLSPEELVKSVDYYFSAFDKIIEKHGLEKIKTVGDAYMCAGGLPFPSADHSIKAIYAAKEIIEFVHNSKAGNSKRTQFDIRVGINTGPVVAGVVGTKKFAYDIWGDTVNIASRMESNSEVGKVNISGNTYNLIKDHFQCDFRGNIDVKNRGKMDMYFVGKEIAMLAS